jgi:hypothetical protein
MKSTIKIIGAIVTLAAIIFTFDSCGSSKNIFDDSIPKENTVLLQIDPSLTVKTYNSVNVNLKTSRSRTRTGFTIPAGKTELIMDLDGGLGNGIVSVTYKAKNIKVDYLFEAGHKYIIGFAIVDDNGKIYYNPNPNAKYFVYISEERSRTPLAAWEIVRGNTVLE